MNKLLQAFVIACLASFAAAETLVEAYGLGNARPVPEEWTKIDEILSVRAQIVDAATGRLIKEAKIGQKLRLTLDFYVQPGAEDRDIALQCSLYFYDATGETKGPELEDQPCYAGRLVDGLEQFRSLEFDMTFRPPMGAAMGSWAAVVRVDDTVLHGGVALAPTFRVKGN